MGILTSFFMTSVYLKKYGKLKLFFDLKFYKEFFTDAVIIGFIQIVTMFIHYFSILMLSFQMNNHAVGLFNASYRALWLIITFMTLIHNLSSTLLFEKYKINIQQFKDYFQKYFKFILFLGIFVTIFFTFNAQFYLGLFYNLNSFANSVLCFKILLGSFFLMTINCPIVTGFYTTHNEKTLLKIVIFQFSCNVVGNYLLIPVYGINGAALSTIITEGSGFLIYIFLFKKIIDFKILKNFLYSILCSIPFGLFLYFINWPIYFKIPASIFIYLISVLLFRGYTLSEINEFKNLIFKKI